MIYRELRTDFSTRHTVNIPIFGGRCGVTVELVIKCGFNMKLCFTESYVSNCYSFHRKGRNSSTECHMLSQGDISYRLNSSPHIGRQLINVDWLR